MKNKTNQSESVQKSSLTMSHSQIFALGLKGYDL
jgi:hypothetical protein